MSNSEDSVGLLGLGSIGQIYGDHLLQAWPGLGVFDRDSARVARMVNAGAVARRSGSELGSTCGVIVVSLPNPPAVRQALAGEDGVFAGAASGTVIVDMSTVSPATSREMAALAAERGIDYLDAPVSGGAPMQGGVDGAGAGSLTFMVGGEESAFQRARSVMETLGDVFFHLGPSGSGSTVKLISNLVSGVYALVAAEAFTLGAAAGFAPERLVEVFQETDAKSFFMTDYLVPRLLRDDVQPGFSVALQLKDHRLASELGHEYGVPLLLNALATQIWEALRASGREGNDVTDAIRFMAEQAGVSLQSEASRAGAAASSEHGMLS